MLLSLIRQQRNYFTPVQLLSNKLALPPTTHSHNKTFSSSVFLEKLNYSRKSKNCETMNVEWIFFFFTIPNQLLVLILQELVSDNKMVFLGFIMVFNDRLTFPKQILFDDKVTCSNVKHKLKCYNTF